MAGEDRLTLLLTQPPDGNGRVPLTGIDFVRVVDPTDQRVLHVYFLVDPESELAIGSRFSDQSVALSDVHIESLSGGERLASVLVTGLRVVAGAAGRNVLEVTVDEPGDFSLYELRIDDPRLDRFFRDTEFSFKQGCPSDLDCERQPPECPPEALVDFSVDYLARDFESLRSALLAYSSLRYPDWMEPRLDGDEPNAADVGVMTAELMAALGDDLSYVQDRYSREAHLGTATQRRSIRRHARLVDYAVHGGRSALTYLDLSVQAALAGVQQVSAGWRVWARVRDATAPLVFELGEGLRDYPSVAAHTTYSVSAAWNEVPAYNPDPGEPCAEIGATELFLVGHLPGAIDLNPGAPPGRPSLEWRGRRVLLRSDPKARDELGQATGPHPISPARRHLVRITEVEHLTDPLNIDPVTNAPVQITRIAWEEEQALPFELPLANTVLRGNLVPATAGETLERHFVVRENSALGPPGPLPDFASTVERQGPYDAIARARSPTFLFSLPETETRGLGWVPPRRPEAEAEEDVDEVTLADPTPDAELRTLEPEVELFQVQAVAGLPDEARWDWRRDLLGSPSLAAHFTLDEGIWRRVVAFERKGETFEHADYATTAVTSSPDRGDGYTIRFGDGEFGRIPPYEGGSGAVFRVRYRTGPGRRANLAADTVTQLANPFDPAVVSQLANIVDAAANPLPITGGRDPESREDVRMLAPDAFREVTWRAVRAEDYRAIAERLPWVQRAGASFRWTGSWLSVSVTPDPRDSFHLDPEPRRQLTDLMDAVRQAGREVHIRDPEFVNVDLEIDICVEPFAYAGQVKEAVIDRLAGRRAPWDDPSFFDPDHFTFGTPLRRAAIEAAVQGVPGVLSVDEIRIQARGITELRVFSELAFEPGDWQVLRLQNDPRLPERGSLKVYVRNGAAA